MVAAPIITTLFFGLTCLALFLSLRLYVQHRLQLKNIIDVVKEEQQVQAFRMIMLQEERERKKIGRVLHDRIGGDLVATKLSLGEIKKLIGKDAPPQLKDKVNNTMKQINKTIASTRQITTLLNPLVLELDGFDEGIKHLISDANLVNDQIQFSVEFEKNFSLTKFQELNFYWIVRELINNAFKHSQASKVTIRFSRESGIHLEYHDNGKGLKNNAGEKLRIGSLGYRVDTLGGRMKISSPSSNSLSINIFVYEKQSTD